MPINARVSRVALSLLAYEIYQHEVPVVSGYEVE